MMTDGRSDSDEATGDELLEDLSPDAEDAEDVQGGWRYRQEEPEEEELQM